MLLYFFSLLFILFIFLYYVYTLEGIQLYFKYKEIGIIHIIYTLYYN